MEGLLIPAHQHVEKKIKFRSTSVETPSFFSHLSSCGIYISPIKCLAVAPFAKKKKKKVLLSQQPPHQEIGTSFQVRTIWGARGIPKIPAFFFKTRNLGFPGEFDKNVRLETCTTHPSDLESLYVNQLSPVVINKPPGVWKVEVTQEVVLEKPRPT